MAEFEDNWVTEAMLDETIVANFLLSFAKLNRDSPTMSFSRGTTTTSDGGNCEESSHQMNPIDASGFNKVGDQSEVATNPSMSGEVVLNPHQIVEAHSNQSKLVSPQTIQDNVIDEGSPDSPEQQETSNQEPKFLLPDLNLPVEEEEEDVNCDVVPPELS